MRIIFSRKGFDTSPQGGGGASPIIDGRPVSLPIPAGKGPSRTTYGDLGLGELAIATSRGRIAADTPCHHDPMFLEDGTAILGQCGAAQSHLARGGVSEGDLFVFFGLFRDGSERPHHRIFGYLQVEQMVALAEAPDAEVARLADLGFPHALAMIAGNDTAYCGAGRTARSAPEALRLTVPEGPPSMWHVPAWLRETGLTYHARPSRWADPGRLRAVSRGQEFIADVGSRQEPRAWAERIVALIERG